MSAFIDEQDVSASAYHERACGRRSARALEDERLHGRISEIHASNYYAYGSRRMWKALRRKDEHAGRGRRFHKRDVRTRRRESAWATAR